MWKKLYTAIRRVWHEKLKPALEWVWDEFGKPCLRAAVKTFWGIAAQKCQAKCDAV